MKISQFQARLIFTKCIIDLLNFCEKNEIQVSIGEILRMEAQQIYNVKHGLSKTMDSYHLKGLAVDINIFKNNKVCADESVFSLLATFWESLHENTRAGYFWGWDKLHFEFHLDTSKKN